MSETRTYVIPEGGNNNGILGLLAPLMQKNGLDPNMVFAMMNGKNNGFGNEGGWFIWVIFLFFLMGWGNNGWGGFGGCNGANGISNLINNDAGRELLMQAIQGNGNAINQLATNLNCSVGQIQNSINQVMGAIQGVANQVGTSAQQIINAIQSGNCSIASKIADCCCENRLAICQQTNTLQSAINNVAVGQERGFSSVAYETQRQTCDLQNTIKDSTAQILAGQAAAEKREMMRELASKDEKISALTTQLTTEHQTAQFGQMIGQAVAPANAALADLSARLAKIECKQPETVTVPYSPIVGVPTCVAAQYGIYGGLYSGNPGFWG